MTFWYCYYHVVWATYLRSPLLESTLESLVHTWVKDKSAALKAEVLAVNGTQDHIHVYVSIPPKLSPADWVKNIKGYTTHEANGRFPNMPERFRWQSGYGVLTISPRHLEYVLNYINRQKQHHADGKLNPNFERMSDDD